MCKHQVVEPIATPGARGRVTAFPLCGKRSGHHLCNDCQGQPQTHRYYAQVVVNDCDESSGGIVDDTVDILLGDLPVGPGEVALAEMLADIQVDGVRGCFVSCVWHEEPEIEDVYW